MVKKLKDRPVVERAASVYVNAQCWELAGCTGMNAPSATRCMVGGCGLLRFPRMFGEKVVGSKCKEQRKEAEVVAKKKEHKLNSHGKKSGRKAGLRIYTQVVQDNSRKIAGVRQEALYWKQHKMVPQEHAMKARVDGKV